MSRSWNRCWSAAAVFGVASALTATTFANGHVLDDAKPAQPVEKSGETKKPEFDPKDVRVGPPAELAALREAVEAAAKKGENVDEIRKQLDALEKALAGKAWVKPKPVEPTPVQPFPGGNPVGPMLPAFPQPLPAPGGFQPPAIAPAPPFLPDRDALAKAQEMMMKAQKLLAMDPNDPEAKKLFNEARDLMLKAMRPQGGARFDPPVIQVLPPFPPAPVFPGPVGFSGEGRLGVRIERIPAVVAEQLDLPKDQGIVVAEVVKGSPAEKAGLKVNDIILEFAGKPVPANPAEFVRMVFASKKDEKVDVTLLRKGKKETIKGIEIPEAKFGVLQPGGGDGLELPAVPVPMPIPAPNGVEIELPPPLRGGGAAPGLPQQSSTQIQIQNGSFTLKATQDTLMVVIEGKVDGAKLEPAMIKLTDGNKTIEAATVEKLPAEYRERVQKILDNVKVKQ